MLVIELKDSSGEPYKVKLEHSLVAMSEWEAIHEKPFFKNEEKTEEETKSYIRQMVLGDVPDDFEDHITYVVIEQVQLYINAKRSATWFREENNQKPGEEATTSELIYYWMITFKIPSDYQHWHLNRLLTLIKICGIKQTPPKKMDKVSQHEMMRKLNAERKKDLGTSG